MAEASNGENGALGGNAKEQLKAFVERVERLEEEKKAIADDIKDVYGEAKSSGFDTKAIRAIIRRRKADPDKQAELDALIDVYMHALGMLADTPLGGAAVEALRKGEQKRQRKGQA
jgi:uncharacterized protein (UPF0335 family)